MDKKLEEAISSTFKQRKKPDIITNYYNRLSGSDLKGVDGIWSCDWNHLSNLELQKYKNALMFLNPSAYVALAPKLMISALENPHHLHSDNLVGFFLDSLSAQEPYFTTYIKNQYSLFRPKELTVVKSWIGWAEKAEQEISEKYNFRFQEEAFVRAKKNIDSLILG